MEGHPEEDDHTEDSKESIDALLDFSCTHLYFARRGSTSLSRYFLLTGIGELLLINQEDDSRDTDHHYSSDESIVEATAKDIQILVDEGLQVRDFITRHLSCEALKVLHCLLGHTASFTQVLMTESWELCAIVEAIVLQPPVTDTDRHEGSEDPPDVDEHVEDLEASITCTLVAWIIVHLANKHLKVPLEEAITEGDNPQTNAGQRQIESEVGHRCRRRDSDQHIAKRHHHQTSYDGSLVLLSTVSDDTTNKRQQVDRGIECRVNVSCCLLAQPELCRDEERQDCHHDVEAEALSHVCKRGCDQSLRMIFEHKFRVLG